GILYDEKSCDEGLTLLSGAFRPGFAEVVADRKRDSLAAQGKMDEARTACRQALENAAEDDPAHQYIQLKLDAIGGGAANPAAGIGGNDASCSHNAGCLAGSLFQQQAFAAAAAGSAG